MLEEESKDRRSLDRTFLRSMLMLSWILHLGMSSFTNLKKKQLPNKKGKRSKKKKNAAIASTS